MRSPLRRILERIAAEDPADVDLLALLVKEVRPTREGSRRGAVPKFGALLELLATDERLRQGLADHLARLLDGRRLSRNLLDAGMPLGGFWFELRERLIYKLLPYQPERDTIDHILANVFFREYDGEWVGALETTQLVRFVELMGGRGLHELPLDSFWMRELLFAVKALGLRIAGKAFDSEVLRMVPEYATFESPFVALEAELDAYLNGLLDGSVGRGVEEPSYRQVLVLMGQGRELIERAYRNSGKYGIGFRVNQHLMTLDRMLDRMEVVLRAIVIDPHVGSREALVHLAQDMVRFTAGSTHVMSFVDRSTQVVAREVTQHAGRTGEHYITSTRSQYLHMLRSSLGGGAVVAVACLLKAWMGTWEMSLFGQAFVYSANYAGAFITIFLLHLTLATKQPAMTAATLAAALDEGRRGAPRERYVALGVLVARVWRSQFIAFVGNVFMAFPVALVLGLGWGLAFGDTLLSKKSSVLIHELDPFSSLAVLHAAFAGVFLFLAGLIAGSANNRSLHRRIPQRIEGHPVLKLMLGPEQRRNIASFYDRNFGGIVSNLWFGVFMGSLGTVGIILGLPLDIRHITFAAGNFALGLVGNGFTMSPSIAVISVLGIGLIGFMNFIVSFGLSLMLALRSRGIPFLELVRIAAVVRDQFRRSPRSFFVPPAQDPEPGT